MRENILISICIIFLFTGCYNREKIVDKQTLLAKDYRLFQNTPAWQLAKAVEDQDTLKIREEILNNKIDPNYQEPKYGGRLLMFAVFNNQYVSTQTLLSLGADPNLRDNIRGASSMIYASKNEDPKYLKLLLDFKGDPNSVENAPVKSGDEVRDTPLNAAIPCYRYSSLEKVKLLVEAGADIDYSNKGTPAYTRLPLGLALMLDKTDIGLYLLQSGADYKKVMYTVVDGDDVYILEALRKQVLDLDSKGHQDKIKIIRFLKNKGLDYDKEPIPEYIKKEIKSKHPKDWEEYLQKY